MDQMIDLDINSDSQIPKYQQIINSIIKDIEFGHLKVGQKIPSINEISEEYYISRDTVEKAYKRLKEKKIIISTKGKGYYVARNLTKSGARILFLLNKLSSYKMRIYNSFVDSMGSEAHVELKVYHCDASLFKNILEENLGGYDYYLIMPHFVGEDSKHHNSISGVLEVISQIPTEKLILLDNVIPEFHNDYSAVYQDFKQDIYQALQEGKDVLGKYDRMVLIFPDNPVYPYPTEILQGFRMFCVENHFDHEIISGVYKDMDLKIGHVYIVIEENDLVTLVKQIRDSQFQLGKDIGIISYNDTPLKDLLGISCISTDFQLMGETAAYMILKKKQEKVKNVFGFVHRHSV